MRTEISTFAKSARDLSRTPLGIIALFIVLVYGVAALVVGVSPLPKEQAPPLVWFLVIFPVLVLAMFGWLVSYHHINLYHPADLPYEVIKAWLNSQLGVTPAPEPAGTKKRKPWQNPQLAITPASESVGMKKRNPSLSVKRRIKRAFPKTEHE